MISFCRGLTETAPCQVVADMVGITNPRPGLTLYLDNYLMSPAEYGLRGRAVTIHCLLGVSPNEAALVSKHAVRCVVPEREFPTLIQTWPTVACC